MNVKRMMCIWSAVVMAAALCLCGCSNDTDTADFQAETTNEITGDIEQDENVRIIVTSDMHGKMLGFDYTLDEPDMSGSLAQVSTAIEQYRDDNTILVDVGDTIQDNLADIFNDEPVHPMVQGMNAIGYDICVTGNHEYNYGMDTVRKYMNTLDAKCLLGNVYDEKMQPLADGYTIMEKNGIRIAFIGMVTPNIVNWDKDNLDGYTVTDPAIETNRIIDEIEEDINNGKIAPVDAYVGVFHMMDNGEYETKNSGWNDVAHACPRLNIILGAHGHECINSTLEGDIAVVENESMGKTIQVVNMTFATGENTKTDMAKPLKGIITESVKINDYEEDAEIVKLFAPYDERAKEYSETVIGTIAGNWQPKEMIEGINPMLLEDTPVQSLIQEVMMYYADADVALSAPNTNEDGAQPGEMAMSDISRIYKFANSLCCVKMSGLQLRKYLEWSAGCYQQYEDNDVMVAFKDVPVYMFDTASGVNYEIDISKPEGERIVNLTYPDGKEVTDDDELKVAVNDYRYSTSISLPGVIYEKDDIPQLIETDIGSDIGDIRFLIIDYIKNVKGGTVENKCDNNWRLIGCDWDEQAHNKAVKLVNNKTIDLTSGKKGTPCIRKITVDDLE